VQTAVDAATGEPAGLRIAVCCAGIGWAQRVAGRNGPHDQAAFEKDDPAGGG
jgi:hypothetical protein